MGEGIVIIRRDAFYLGQDPSVYYTKDVHLG
jgi:hypothetical protein